MHCKSYSHFISKKIQHICVSLDVNFNESLTNDIVSFEQLGPDYIALTCLILLQDTEGSDEFSQELLSEMFSDSDGASDQDYTQTGRQQEAPAANKYTFKSGNYIFKFLFDFHLNVFFFFKLEES